MGVSHNVTEAKTMAEEIEYEDGPDSNGDMFQRAGKLSDYMPRPYANEEAARSGNAGALPPDLSLITKARHGGAVRLVTVLTPCCTLTFAATHHRITSWLSLRVTLILPLESRLEKVSTTVSH